MEAFYKTYFHTATRDTSIGPHSDYHRKTFDYSSLRIPFSKCYVYNHVRIKGEDVRKGRKGIFCGYVKDSKVYKIWVISASDYEFTADVTWDEQNLQPLLQAARTLEQGENPDFNTTPKPGPSGDGEKVSTAVSAERHTLGSNENTSSLSTEDFTITDFDEWTETAMTRIGNFCISDKRIN